MTSPGSVCDVFSYVLLVDGTYVSDTMMCVSVCLFVAVPLGLIVIENNADLEEVRRHINHLNEVH